MNTGTALDIPFGPRFVHRVRFAPPGRAFAADGPLPALLEADGERPRVLVVLDEGVATAQPGLAERVARFLAGAACRADVRGPAFIAPGGEAVKNSPRHAQAIVAAIHDAGLCRRSYVVAIGGGAVLDAAGFAAATAHRGVRLIRIPTTTLAQADSCVAVKCGINAFGKKNYLGVFAAAWGVVLDPALLETLPERDWRSGFSEAVKVGVVKDAALFEALRASAPRIAARDLGAAWPVIRRSCEIHLRHITDGGDPFELDRARPLDFGHWAAHRLESMTGHRLRHGEAVAIGIAIDTAYAARAGFIAPGAAALVRSVLLDLGFTLDDPALREPEALLGGLEEFREHLGGRLTVSMPRGIGEAFDVHTIDHALMRAAIAELAAAASSRQPHPSRLPEVA